jgi:hypothetical protein
MSDVIEILTPATPETLEVVVAGPQGVQGDTGPANTLAIGTVTTGAAGSSADATITGDAPNQTLNLTIPTGATGATGPQGPTIADENAASTNNILWQIRTSGFTAASGGRYVCNGTFSVTNPATGNNGELFQVVVASGTVTVNGVAYGASRWPITVARVAGAWTTLANTLTENLTLNGTNNVMPNQTTADSGSSIMTRDLMQTRFLDWQLSNVFPVSTIPSAWSVSAVGTGARGTNTNSLDILTGATANSSYAVANRPNGLLWYTRPGSATSTTTLEWSQAVRVDFMMWVVSASTNSIFRFLIGANTTAAVADLDRRGVGIRLENLALKLHVHDGTTATTSSTLSTLSTNTSYSLSIRKAAESGTVELFLNGSSVGSTTGGPSTNSGGSADGFVASILNGIDASSARVTLQKIIFAYT